MLINTDDKIRKVMSSIKTSLPEYDVYLAGGYVRDKILGLLPEDVDLFLVPKVEYNYSGGDWVFDGMLCNAFFEISSGTDSWKRGIREIYAGVMECGTAIQVIVYNRPLTVEQLVDDFDINICQAAYADLELKELVTSPAFDKGVAEKNVRFEHTFGKERRIDRMARMQKKRLKGFSFEYPEDFTGVDIFMVGFKRDYTQFTKCGSGGSVDDSDIEWED